MLVGAVGAFPSPVRSIRSMVDLPGPSPSGRYAQSTDASPPSLRAGYLRIERPWTHGASPGDAVLGNLPAPFGPPKAHMVPFGG